MPAVYKGPALPPRRTYWVLDGLDDPNRDKYGRLPVPREAKSIQQANLVSSLTVDGQHAPAIDLDMPCRLYPSRSPGHFHLYIDTAIAWSDYKRILEAFHSAGLVQAGFLRNSVARKASFLRLPGAKPACTQVGGAGPDGDDLSELRMLVRSMVGSRGRGDELDEKVARMEEAVYSMMAAKIDEIVTRRVQRALHDK